MGVSRHIIKNKILDNIIYNVLYCEGYQYYKGENHEVDLKQKCFLAENDRCCYSILLKLHKVTKKNVFADLRTIDSQGNYDLQLDYQEILLLPEKYKCEILELQD